MRRSTTTFTLLALLCGLVGAIPPTTAAADTVSTVWQLVTRTCTGQEVQAGRACFDPAGHAADYDSVTDTEADGKDQGEQQTYLYDLPEQIATGQSNQASLTAGVDGVTDGGAHARVCLSGAFGHAGTDEPCATTAEAPNGQSASASHTVVLLPSSGTSGQEVTVTLMFEEPGGYLNFSYLATNPTTQVAFNISGQKTDFVDGGSLTIAAKGGFTAAGNLDEATQSRDEHGAGTIHFQKTASSPGYTVHINFVRAVYRNTGATRLFFRVARSTLRCLPARRQVEVTAVNHRYLAMDVCDDSHTFEVSRGEAHVHIAAS